MKAPLISVVLPTHNRVEFLERSIGSVLRQTEENFELIIVDDASNDGTAEFLTKLLNLDPRVRVLYNTESLGGGAARNLGISASRGSWIAFLDDDDEWLPNKLTMQLDKLAANPHAVACSCGFEQISPLGLSKTIILAENVTLKQLLQGSVLGGASMCMCSKQALLAIGGFDAKFKSGQDWDLWLRLRQEGAIVVCNEVLVKYQAHDGLRISTNMRSQYLGARRFYFKHRHLMDESLRRHRVAYSAFIMSRQFERGLCKRFYYLKLASISSPFKIRLSYILSSAPRLIVDSLSAKNIFH